MVYYFESNRVDPPALIYMGKDKFENEELIKHAWENDVWFHVDKLSSAHVYLRMTDGMSWDSIPQELLEDLAQLTKANSIEGIQQYTTFNILDRKQKRQFGNHLYTSIQSSQRWVHASGSSIIQKVQRNGQTSPS